MKAFFVLLLLSPVLFAKLEEDGGSINDGVEPAAADVAPTVSQPKSIAKNITDQIEEHSKKKNKISPVQVGCYSAVISNILTIGFIILIAVVWYFGCIRYGRCCCSCCYNKNGRCCCASSCCDGYINTEDEEMIIARGSNEQQEYDSVEKTA